MQEVFFENIFEYKKKSKVKAGDGLKQDEAAYPFYTSSNKLSKSIDEFLFEKPSLIFGTGGMPSVHFCEDKFSVSTDCLVAQPKENSSVYIPYIYYFFKKNDMRILEDGFKGAGLKHISRKYIDKIKIPLPPLKTQQKIASMLDDAAALRDKTKQLLTEYDLLAQSIFLEMFGDPVTNPKGLEMIKLGDLGKWKSGGTPSRKVNKYYEGNIPWLSSGELNEMYISDSKEHITEVALKESSTKLVPKNSLLLGMYDTAALKSTINTIDLTCNQAIAFGVLNPELINLVYAYYIIQIGREYYRRLQRGARQKNLNLSMVKEIKILHPPINLQNQFAEKIALIEQQKALAKQELQESKDLFNCLLQKAFKGEL